MWGQIKRVILAYLSVFIFVANIVAETPAVTDIATTVVSEINNLKDDVSKSELAEILQTNIQTILNLNYFDSTSLSLVLPNGYQYTIDWGFVGAGNALLPLTNVYPTLEKIEESAGDKSDNIAGNDTKDSVSALKKIGAILLKKKLKGVFDQYLQDVQDKIPGFSWLIDMEISPLKVFALKLFLLIKQPFNKEQEVRRKIEVIRLMIRLAQSEVGGSVDSKQSIFMLLPDRLRTLIENNVSHELKTFINDFWTTLKTGFSNYHFDADGMYDKAKVGVVVDGYVFKDADLANDCVQQLKNSKISSFSDFKASVEKILKTKNYESIEYTDYLKHQDTSYKFVGYRNFGSMVNNNDGLQDALAEQVRMQVFNATVFPRFEILQKTEEGQTWVIFVSDKLSMFQTGKLLLASLVQAFDDYRNVKTENNDSNIKVEKQLSEDDLKLLHELLNKKENIEKKVLLVNNQIKSVKKKIDEFKDDLGFDNVQNIIDVLDANHKNLELNKKQYQNDLSNIEKQIQELKNNPFYNDVYNLLVKDNEEAFKKYGLLSLFEDVLKTSPELGELLQVITSENEIYSGIKKDLASRINNILINSDLIKNNIDVCDELIKMFFPKFKEAYFYATKDITRTNDDVILSQLFSSLGLN